MKNRDSYLLKNSMKYLKELLDEGEQYAILYECIGLTEREMAQYGFNVEVIKSKFEE